MNIEQKARQLLTQDRQNDRHLQDNLGERAEEEVLDSSTSRIEEEARELLVENRQHQENLVDRMAERTSEEMGN